MSAASVLSGTPAFVPSQTYSFNNLVLTGTGAPQVIFTGPSFNLGEVWMLSFQFTEQNGEAVPVVAAAYGYTIYSGTTEMTSITTALVKGTGESGVTVTLNVSNGSPYSVDNFVLYRVA